MTREENLFLSPVERNVRGPGSENAKSPETGYICICTQVVLLPVVKLLLRGIFPGGCLGCAAAVFGVLWCYVWCRIPCQFWVQDLLHIFVNISSVLVAQCYKPCTTVRYK